MENILKAGIAAAIAATASVALASFAGALDINGDVEAYLEQAGRVKAVNNIPVAPVALQLKSLDKILKAKGVPADCSLDELRWAGKRDSGFDDVESLTLTVSKGGESQTMTLFGPARLDNLAKGDEIYYSRLHAAGTHSMGDGDIREVFEMRLVNGKPAYLKLLRYRRDLDNPYFQNWKVWSSVTCGK